MANTDFLDLGLKRFKLAYDSDQPQRDQEGEDLGFQIPRNQWPADVQAARGANTVAGIPIPARPMLSVAPVDEPIQLVSNQARAAHLACSFHPRSADATDDTADVLQGLYEQSANDSRADNARFWAYDRALWCGRGVYMLDKAYDPNGGHPFDQKIIWRRLLFQETYFRDPFAQEPDRSDAMYAFVVENIPVDRYKGRYPKSKLAQLTDDGLMELAEGFEGLPWIGGDDEASRTVQVAQYWRVVITTTRWYLHDDGQVYPEGQAPKGVKPLTGDQEQCRDEETRQVFVSKINCYEVVEPEQEWDGQYLPFIEVIGRELLPVKGKRRWAGMITNAKDAARLVNYAASGAVEVAALEPRAPFELDPKQIEGYEHFWQQSNTRNFPYLPYHTTVEGQPTPPPARTQVDVSRLGPNMQILSMGGSMLQASMSTFDPALGKQPTAHRSGRALEALQGQTVEANSHYMANLANISLMYEARVWLDLAPHVYDRAERVVRILQGDGPSKLVMLGAPYLPPQGTQTPQALPLQPGVPVPPNALHFDLSKGSYGVAVTIGKSSASRLQAGSDALTTILQAEPGLISVVGPEWARFQDFPGSKKLAELLQKNRDHQMPWLADNPQAAMMDPQRLASENQVLKQQLGQAMQAIQSKQIEKQAELQGKFQIAGMQESAETQRAREANETKLAVAALTSKVETLQTMLSIFADERARLGTQGHDAGIAALDRAHEVAMAGLDHGAALTQADQQHHSAMAQGQQQADLQPPSGPDNNGNG
jgi:hypothetical protein